MDAFQFLEKHGKEVAEQVAIKAGSNYAYFSQIAYGHRRPSVDLAHKLVAASEELVADPAARLDPMALLQPRREVRVG